MKKQFLIGELAALFQISTDTLRYYDRIDLIKPDIVGSNGYRYYSLRSFLKLSRILFLKDLDIPLEDIKGYMGNKNTEKLVAMLHQKDVALDEKIQSCMNLKQKIHQKLNLLENARMSGDLVHIKTLPERHFLRMSSSTFSERREVRSMLSTYSRYLKFSSWITEGQIYTSVPLVRLENHDFSEFDYVFEIPLKAHAVDSPLEHMPAADYACMLFIGPYSEIDRHYDTLLKWISDNGFKPCGDSIEMNIVDYDFSDSDAEFISELQIPILQINSNH